MRASADRGVGEAATQPRITTEDHRITTGDTVPTLPVEGGGRPVGAGGRALRGVAGALVAGLLVLTVALAGVQLWGLTRGGIGPGWVMLSGHVLAAVAALLLQSAADRVRRPAGGWYALGAMAVVLTTLSYWWWS
ncbi:hypothetical protein SAMN04487905_11024 [Actinopolyspora xinjiangensis]|uniref:Uncharacterized protein n=1 Tax=Actinopolyspora xinjiangensis TaxID=405564 RepID=A0A1H0VYZ1_9ACTN|nr:hypothetical protein [Actinopolyspora xinjiangensis]SDP83503.1 hypothetical protein SAMN04487905_11024 [Actinopolyspora xinjiangensis]